MVMALVYCDEGELGTIHLYIQGKLTIITFIEQLLIPHKLFWMLKLN